MPMPNNHACLINSKLTEVVATVQRKHNGKVYKVRRAHAKGKTEIGDRSYLYPKDTWETDEARNHCKAHDGTFEAAKKSEDISTPAKPMEKRILSPCELRTETDGETGVVEGWAAVFEVSAEDGRGGKEKIRQNAFAKTLKENPDIKLLYNHNPEKVLGRTSNGTLELKEKPHGLWFKAKLNLGIGYIKDAYESIKDKLVDQMSFGFRVIKDQWTLISKEDGAEINERELIELQLFEVSPVTFPFYPTTEVGVRSALQKAGIEPTKIDTILEILHAQSSEDSESPEDQEQTEDEETPEPITDDHSDLDTAEPSSDSHSAENESESDASEPSGNAHSEKESQQVEEPISEQKPGWKLRLCKQRVAFARKKAQEIFVKE